LLKDKIESYWGTTPIEGYACTEGGALAVQTRDSKGMIFYPDSSFFEFIPHEEHQRSKNDAGYRPNTVLIDELEPGIYEVVLSSFYGGVFVRYRVGDLIRVLSLGDKRHRSDLPQCEFYSRADDVIALAGFCVLTERAIWQAIELSGFSYVDWTARKEYEQDEAVLHIYIEMDRNETAVASALEAAIHRNLQELDPDYADLEHMLGIVPISVTILPSGSFMRYYVARQQEGADLAHLKPPHMNPAAEVLERLMSG
jgi:phenylacetate-coenzyme A ligase PaaK-like adenylate-forming protein